MRDDRFLGLIRFDSNFDNFSGFKALVDTKPRNSLDSVR